MMRIFSSKKVEIYFYIITHTFSILLGDILILLAMTIVDIRPHLHKFKPTLNELKAFFEENSFGTSFDSAKEDFNKYFPLQHVSSFNLINAGDINADHPLSLGFFLKIMKDLSIRLNLKGLYNINTLPITNSPVASGLSRDLEMVIGRRMSEDVFLCRYFLLIWSIEREVYTGVTEIINIDYKENINRFFVLIRSFWLYCFYKLNCTCHLISPTNKRKYSNSNNEESDGYSSDSSSDSSLEFEIDELDFDIDFKIGDILCEMSDFGTEKLIKKEVRRYFDEFKYYFEGLEAEDSFQNDSYQNDEGRRRNIKMDNISITFCNERIVKTLVDQYISNNEISFHERRYMSDVDSIKFTLVSLSRPCKCEWCLHRFFLINHSYKINLMKGENAILNFEANINLSAKCYVDDKLNELFG